MSYLLQVSSALSFSQSGWINNLWVSMLVYISSQPSSRHIYGCYLSCSIQDQVFKHPFRLRASIMSWCLWDNFTWGSSFSRFTTSESMVLREDQSLIEQIVNSISSFEEFAYLYSNYLHADPRQAMFYYLYQRYHFQFLLPFFSHQTICSYLFTLHWEQIGYACYLV